MKFIKKVILIFNIFLVLGLLLAYLSPYFDPNEYWIFSIFGLFYPLLLLLNIGMILFWSFVEFKHVFPSLLAIVIGLNHLLGFINIGDASSKINPEHLTVMSYNLGKLYNIQKKNKKHQKKLTEEYKVFLSEYAKTDIFCLQEVSKFSKDLFSDVFPKYHMSKSNQTGTFIFSKYPIVKQGLIDFGTKVNSCIWADIKIDKDTIRLFNVHLQSNNVSHDAEKVLGNANLQEKKTWVGIGGILSKYSNTSRTRATQADRVHAHANQSPYPTFVCGDQNDPPTSYTYHSLSDGFNDAFVDKGSGIGTTYNGRLPMLRIDYILSSKDIQTESFKVIKENYSDHFPILGSFTIR